MTEEIKLIVVDLDGTLLNSDHQMTERTEKALKTAIQKGVQVVIATGKTYLSARDLIDRLGLTTPGIYLQGLAIYNGDGTIKHQQTLDSDLARTVITFGEERGFTMVAYSGTRILVRSLNEDDRILSEKYHEPVPEAVGPLQNLLGNTPINKIIAIRLNDARRITALRWQLGVQLGGKAKLTQALLDMLEILPPGASKGTALKVLLRDMGIASANVMAIGDGENDIEMIQMAGVGVAMANASQKLKDVATYITTSNDEDGIVQAIEKYIPSVAEALQPVVEGVTNAAVGEAEGKEEAKSE